MTLDDIKRYWEDAGKAFPMDGKISPTSRDPFLGELEEENIASAVKGCRQALEVGCGDGMHTARYAECVEWLSGVDVADTLVRLARKRMSAKGITNVDVSVGSVLDVEKSYGSERFDCVISQRCLINLPDWKFQKEAILRIRNVLKPQGLFVLTEGFKDELANLNVFRKKLGLDEIREVSYNRSLVRTEFEKFVHPRFEIVKVHDYGTYLFLSRVLHPLVVLPDAPKHDARLNEVAMAVSRVLQLPPLRECSYNLCYVLMKKRVHRVFE